MRKSNTGNVDAYVRSVVGVALEFIFRSYSSFFDIFHLWNFKINKQSLLLHFFLLVNSSPLTTQKYITAFSTRARWRCFFYFYYFTSSAFKCTVTRTKKKEIIKRRCWYESSSIKGHIALKRCESINHWWCSAKQGPKANIFYELLLSSFTRYTHKCLDKHKIFLHPHRLKLRIPPCSRD